MRRFSLTDSSIKKLCCFTNFLDSGVDISRCSIVFLDFRKKFEIRGTKSKHYKLNHAKPNKELLIFFHLKSNLAETLITAFAKDADLRRKKW